MDFIVSFSRRLSTIRVFFGVKKLFSPFHLVCISGRFRPFRRKFINKRLKYLLRCFSKKNKWLLVVQRQPPVVADLVNDNVPPGTAGVSAMTRSGNLDLCSDLVNIAEREAGFYTTRFGRSDPMMRFRETHTSFVPESFPLEYSSNKV